MKIKLRSAYSLLLTIIILNILGCATSRMYSGPAMSSDQVAFLERGDIAQILEVVDENKSVNFFLLNSAVEILPGKHTISVGYGDGSKRGYPYGLTFTAKPNVRYVIKSDFVNSRWKPYIIEKKSNKKVSETPINLIPMYGYPKIKKTESQKNTDEKFIKSVVENSGSREKASKEFSAWGWSERRKGNIDNAMRRFNQAWLLDKNYYQPYWGFGAILTDQGDAAKASIYFNKALNLINDEKEKARLLVDTARSYSSQAIGSKKNDIEKANNFYRKAISLIEESLNSDPEYSNAYHAGALIYYSYGDFDNAWRIVKKSKELNVYDFDPKFIELLSGKMKEPK